MVVRINGEKKEFKGSITLSALLKRLKIDKRAVVVELNHRIVKKEAFSKTYLKDKDNIEIVHFVGGGVLIG